MITSQQLCFLSILITVCRGQHSVTQDPLVKASPGQHVRMSCQLGGGLTVNGNHVLFVQQKEMNKPKFIMRYGSDSSKWRGDDVPARFVVSGSGSTGYMDIIGVQEEDEADYYCATWTGAQWMFGDGTQLHVQTGENIPPAVVLFGPSKDELENNTATLVCTAGEFKPRLVTMEFLVDGQKRTNGFYMSPITKQSDSSYMGSSFLTMTSSDYSKYKEYTCKVTHQGKEIIRTLKRSECF